MSRYGGIVLEETCVFSIDIEGDIDVELHEGFLKLLLKTYEQYGNFTINVKEYDGYI